MSATKIPYDAMVYMIDNMMFGCIDGEIQGVSVLFLCNGNMN